ncbi:MAG: hypothetical protein JRH20_10020 [Deltaproteobacteria bacterium]|nr:hypothetical protein [Deltaproteobacteria bacterium]
MSTNKTASIGRRAFIGASGASALGLACSLESRQATNKTPDPTEWWREGDYFVHDTVDTSRCSAGIIRARIEGRWRDLKLAQFPKAYYRWSITERMERLRRLAKHGFSTRDLAGPHNGCVATYGGPSRDSAVSLNTAYKGLGFLPRKEKLATTLRQVRAEGQRIEGTGKGFQGKMVEKIQFLAKLYQQRDLFDMQRKVSLELFTEPAYFTHTFLNMMVNPIASASFLAYPTFELRTVPQLLHPKNPNLSTYEREVVAYTNAIHDFVHRGNGVQIACIYHLIEVYDDTPSGNAHGRRLV